MVDLTVCVVLDGKTLPQLEVTLPTWRLNRPGLFEHDWLVVYDGSAVSRLDIVRRCGMLGDAKSVRCVDWHTRTRYETQREKMLSAWVLAPPWYVDTAWWMKIDTDAVALKSGEAYQDKWFEGDPAWIGNRWGYTKPADQMERLDMWADLVNGLREYKPLNLPYDPASGKCRHKRMASWLSYYRTDWSKEAAKFASDNCEPNKLPVPSQDGYHFYVATRRKEFVRYVNQKRHGWTNIPRFSKLVDTCKDILAR